MDTTVITHPVTPDAWPARTFRAMGCTITVRLATAAEEATELLAGALAQIAAAERAWSRFDPTSELSRLNAQAGRWSSVSPLLWEAVAAGLAQAAATGGLYDPTLLQAIRAAGYTRSFEELAGHAAPARPSQPGQWRSVQTHPTRRQIKLPPGVGLDLGGIGKGLAAAAVVDQLRPFGPALVDAGGDVAAGAAPPGFPGWPVAIAAPDPGPDGEEDLLWVWLTDATLATSGTDYRRWEQNGVVRHHILDPRTGTPAQTDLVTVSVLNRSAAQAEAWAKAALILGTEAGYLALAHRGLAALLVEQDGRVWITPALRPWIAWQGPRIPAQLSNNA